MATRRHRRRATRLRGFAISKSPRGDPPGQSGHFATRLGGRSHHAVVPKYSLMTGNPTGGLNGMKRLFAYCRSYLAADGPTRISQPSSPCRFPVPALRAEFRVSGVFLLTRLEAVYQAVDPEARGRPSNAAVAPRWRNGSLSDARVEAKREPSPAPLQRRHAGGRHQNAWASSKTQPWRERLKESQGIATPRLGELSRA